MDTRAYIDQRFEAMGWNNSGKSSVELAYYPPDPDDLFISGQSYVTFGFLDYDPRYGVAYFEDGSTDTNWGWGVDSKENEIDSSAITHENMMRLIAKPDDMRHKKLVFSSKFTPDAKSALCAGGRAGIWEIDHLGTNAKVIVFWEDLATVRRFIEPAIKLCAKATRKDPEYDGLEWVIITSDHMGPPNDMEATPDRKAAVDAKRLLHVASPDVKRAMGAKPDYVKRGPSLADRQKAMTSEGITSFITRLLESEIRYGWVNGELVVEAPFTDGEDSYHYCKQDLLPDNSDDWKRWRYSSGLNTVFWWEAPSKEEKETVAQELGGAPKHAYVELHSSHGGNEALQRVMRNRAARTMKTYNLDQLRAAPDDVTRRAGEDMLDATHYPDADKSFVRKWLDREGD